MHVQRILLTIFLVEIELKVKNRFKIDFTAYFVTNWPLLTCSFFQINFLCLFSYNTFGLIVFVYKFRTITFVRT